MIHRNTYINGPTVLDRHVADAGAAGPVLRRPGLRRRGLRRVGGVGSDRRPQRRAAGARAARRRAAADDGDRRARLLRVARGCRRTTSRRTSRSASCRRSTRRRSSRQERQLATSAARAGRISIAGWPDSRMSRCRPLATAHAEGRDRASSSSFSGYNRNVSPHTAARVRHRPDAVPRRSLAARARLQAAVEVAGRGVRHRRRARRFWASCTIAGSAARRRRGGSRRCARSRAIWCARSCCPTIRRRSSARRARSRRCRRTWRIDEMNRLLDAPDVVDRRRPPRPRHSRAVLRLRPAAQRARRISISRTSTWPAGSRGCAARAARSGSCRSITRRPTRCAAMLPDARSAPQRPRRARRPRAGRHAPRSGIRCS